MTEPTPLQRAVEVMDVLRSPGGCPWDAEQTHESLTQYLLEECFEVIEAIETGDPVLLREELGDLLLQVLFHARLAQEASGSAAFGIDEVAGDLVAKLVRRHPHVFGPEAGPPRTAEQLHEVWERQKVAEKGRTSAVDGVPLAQPSLALAAKLLTRASRAGLDLPTGPQHGDEGAQPSETGEPDELIGDRLLEIVRDATRAGVDPEAALRRRARRLRSEIKSAEASHVPGSGE